MATCPICMCKGEDLVFKFYCSNFRCQNFHKTSRQSDEDIADIDYLLYNLWKKYGIKETETEFVIKFLEGNGNFCLNPITKQIEITYPEWLKRRGAKP